VSGLSAWELRSQGPQAGDMTYEEWRRLMDQRWQANGNKPKDDGEDDGPSEDILDILDNNIFGDGFVSSQRR
jgi:hypothetical protein